MRKDGTVSDREVALHAELELLGFPVPACSKSAKLLLGDPYKDTCLVIRASGNTGFSAYFLEKAKLELIRSALEALESTDLMLQKALKYAEEFPAAVDPEFLSRQVGLKVTVGTGHRGYYTRDHRQLAAPGWGILPRGDATVTRTVKELGPHWVLYRMAGKYPRVAWICAPSENVAEAKRRHGGEEGRRRRQESKQRGQEKRQREVPESFEKALCDQFPPLPEKDVQEILRRPESRHRGPCPGGLYWLQPGEAERPTRGSPSGGCGPCSAPIHGLRRAGVF